MDALWKTGKTSTANAMKIIDILEETHSALSANKARSGLTVLGIVIGISSVIALMAIGNGATSSITSSISSIGSNLLMVSPGAARNTGGFGAMSARGSAKTLTVDDANAIVSNVSNVAGMTMVVSSRAQVTTKSANTNTTITGTDSSYANVRNVTVLTGDFISNANVTSYAKAAVIGPTVLTDLFGDDAVADDVIGQTIRISSTQYTIIGVTKSKGSSGSSNVDDVIYIPYTTAQRYISGNKYLSQINVSAASSETMTQVETDISDILLARHKITDSTLADFSITNQADLVATMSSITSTLTYLLGAIGAISLLVGGIGIMNMMLTNVTERMREIGLRKAIGAKRRDISMQFLSEAIALTLIGGIIGITLGWVIAFIVNWTGVTTTSVTLSSVLLAFGVSAGIGIVFGWYPARRASNQNPIDALRYE
ncbi:MAG: ABC transporter permease [Candidatus Kaiserbacteria bacterium]|nr:ABC transporter permease [Candidatus Kaiserbacteria bacterium]